jgi:hypothetical protein
MAYNVGQQAIEAALGLFTAGNVLSKGKGQKPEALDTVPTGHSFNGHFEDHGRLFIGSAEGGEPGV